ncbi:MAG TPA: phospholipase [Sulfurimonas autotrophica]|nr:phospholipase [Sulfurimonas autotrophica]
MKIFILLIVVTTYMFAMEDIVQAVDESKSKIEIDAIVNDKSKENIQQWINAEFGLQPYKTNYLLPFGIADKRYVAHRPGETFKDIEAEIQVSLKLRVAKNLFKLNEKYYLSYTQHSFWQIYTVSSPFRESMYNPEAFVVFPISDRKSILHMRSLKVALAHKSNGQPNTENNPAYNGFNLSKSINYIYATLRLQHQTLITDITLMTPYLGSSDLSDNPDIMKYLGYNKVKFTYFYNEHMFTVMIRGNIDSLKGAVEATYSYPLKKDKSYYYMKFFSGYVESLIDYNRPVTKFAIGFSFSR